MDWILNLYAAQPFWLWLAVGVVLLAIEAAASTEWLLWPAVSAGLTALISALDPPGTLIVAGGETLKAACLALGAQALQVTGRIVPGLPRSILQGGRWAGVEVISKSGAFGTRELWRDLLQDNQLLSTGKPT